MSDDQFIGFGMFAAVFIGLSVYGVIIRDYELRMIRKALWRIAELLEKEPSK